MFSSFVSGLGHCV